MDSFESSAKTRITGALMQNFVQKPVTLMGHILKVESDGKRATLKTTDDHFIQIVFGQPLMTPLNTMNALTEVYGIVLGRNQFQCQDFMQFPLEMSEKFDRNTYNEFVTEFVKNSDEHINCLVEASGEDGVIAPIDNFQMPNGYANDTLNHETSFGNNF